MKFMFRGIYYFFLAFVGLVAILLIVSAFPIPGNFKALVVQSGSMSPAIKMGSIVVVKPANDYKIGEVISFYPYGKARTSMTHRIYDIRVEEEESFYVTKGDANNAADIGEITKNDIFGKVLFSVPLLGYALDFAKRPLGFVLIVIFPAIIIVFDEAKKIYNELKIKRSF